MSQPVPQLLNFRVYFAGVPGITFEDVTASSYIEAEQMIRSKHKKAWMVSASAPPATK